MDKITIEQARDLVTDDMLDSAQEACGDAFRIDCETIIAAALMTMLNADY